jgi:hypothetical protein
MLDFNKQLVGLDGVAVKDVDNTPITLGKLLSGQLASANKGDALKLFTWAQKCYNGETLDLDASDLSTLKEFIKSNESLTVLAKAQLLSVFKD